MSTWSVSELIVLPPRFDILDQERPESVEIVRRGLSRPVVLCRDALLWGQALLAAAKEAGVSEMKVVDIAPATDAEALRTLLLLEDRRGRYSWPERERIASVLERRVASEDRPGLVALTEGRRDPGFFTRVHDYRNLSEDARRLLHEGRIDLRTAVVASVLPAGWTDLVLSPRPSRSRLSHSDLRLILGALDEISRRDGLDDDATMVLTRRILEHDDPVSEADTLRRPTLARMRREMKSIIHPEAGDCSISIAPPKDFEGEVFEVRFPFSGQESFRTRLEGLRALEDRVDDLVNLLR